MDKITKRTCLALKYLYLNCKESQENEFIKKYRSFDALAYAKEFATINMKTSRRAGHTQAIAELFNDLDGRWMVMSYNLNMGVIVRDRCATVCRKRLKKATQSTLQYDDLHIDFTSTFQLEKGYMNGFELNGFILDGTFGLKSKHTQMIYNTFIPSMMYKPYMFFMFVG